MIGAGQLRKMTVALEPVAEGEGMVRYALGFDNGHVRVEHFVGKEFRIRCTGIMTCVSCGREVKKFYGQGFCFPCMRDAPEAAECIVRPELCRAHLGEGRNPQWEREHHAQEHIVYLSFTGAVKVGVTRATQVPTRWIDQGAVAAVEIARAPYRQLAGLIEVELKKQFADRTNWRAMLAPVLPDLELLYAARDKAMRALAYEMGAYAIPDAAPQVIHYPVLDPPYKVVSVNLEKVPEVVGTLAGVKGQYLIWRDGRVLNVRNHSGYHVEVG